MKRLLAVKASAGSGKTFRLVNRYISLLTIDNPTNIIACLLYTSPSPRD